VLATTCPFGSSIDRDTSTLGSVVASVIARIDACGTSNGSSTHFGPFVPIVPVNV
jgi:hypothetical protein